MRLLETTYKKVRNLDDLYIFNNDMIKMTEANNFKDYFNDKLFSYIRNIYISLNKEDDFIREYFTNNIKNLDCMYLNFKNIYNTIEITNLSIQTQLNIELNTELQNLINIQLNTNINITNKIPELKYDYDIRYNYLDIPFNIYICKKTINSDKINFIINNQNNVIKLFCKNIQYNIFSEQTDNSPFRIFIYFIDSKLIIYENYIFFDKVCSNCDIRNIKYICFTIYGNIIKTNISNIRSNDNIIIIKNLVYYSMLKKIIYNPNIYYLFDRNRIKKIISDDNTYKIIFNLFQTIDYSYKDNQINHYFLIFMILVKLLKTNKDCKIQYNLLKIFTNFILKKKQIDNQILIEFVNDVYNYFNKIYDIKNIFQISIIFEITYAINNRLPIYKTILINLDEIEKNESNINYDDIIIEYIKNKTKNDNFYIYRVKPIIEIIKKYTEIKDSSNIFLDILKYLEILIIDFTKYINTYRLHVHGQLIKEIIFYKQKDNIINFIVYLLNKILNDLLINKFYFNNDIFLKTHFRDDRDYHEICSLLTRFYNENVN
jgi:hypothetical protein